MKNTIFLFLGVIIIYMILGSTVDKSNIIPKNAIRMRVVANSDSKYDQKIKLNVKETLERDMYTILQNTTDLNEARILINDNLDKVRNDIYTTLHDSDYNLPFDINFGLNYFPKKKFKGITYDEGYYESVVVTLGEGLGNNWWCVLFPPLCMLEAEETNLDDVEYTTLTKTIIDKYF